MHRRHVLGSLSTLVLAGCAGSDGGSGTTTAEEETTASASPSVSESSLDVTDTGCGSEQDGDAAGSFGERAVAVAGTVIGNNGCYRARLGDVSYDGSSDTCRVVVEAFDDRGDAGGCVECITTISYEATVVFDGRLPGTVEVVHDDLSGEHSVVTVDS